MKILVVMEYWDGDREAAEAVAIQAANLLDSKSYIVSLALVHRFDATPIPTKTVQNLHDKFKKVLVQRCPRQGQGFPFGCNELSYWTLNWPLHDPEVFADTEAIMILEADCVFTRRNWDVELLSEWRKTQAEGKLICGNVIPFGFDGFTSHVNAASMYSKDIARFIGTKLAGGPACVGWDYFHGKNLIPVTYDSPLFFLDYRKEKITPDELFTPRKQDTIPLMYHGVKDDSARRAVDERYALNIL